MVLLDKFMKKISKYPYIVNSEEFKLFSRPSGDIEKSLGLLPRATPDLILSRLRENLHLSEEVDEFTAKRCREEINDFQAFAKKVSKVLVQIREKARAMDPIKKQQNENYNALVDLLSQFEENNLSQYADQNANKLIYGDVGDTELKDKMKELTEEMKNPFFEFYMWIREEINDLEAMLQAIAGRDSIINMKNKTISKKNSCAIELDKLNAGKKTWKTMLKSQSGKQVEITTLTNNIANCERDSELYEKIVRMLDVYLADTALPTFKEEKIKTYYKLIQEFSVAEINNSHASATYWSKVLDHSNLKSF